LRKKFNLNLKEAVDGYVEWVRRENFKASQHFKKLNGGV
jgi:hypothetical protein